MKEVQVRGCELLPCPVARGDSASWIRHDSHYWELLTWVPGEPRLETNPTRELLVNAAAALAQLHSCTETIPYSPLIMKGAVLRDVSRGIQDRARLARDWIEHDAAKVSKLLEQRVFPQPILRLFKLQQAAFRKYGSFLTEIFQNAFRAHDRKLPVLRDVQPGHVIFNGSVVAGFIDLSAARADSAMSDLARLLQRWRFAESAWYADAVEAYHRFRPLTSDERLVLEAYDVSARMLTGVQWLQWIVLEEREFANQTLVEQHWERAAHDYEQLLDVGWPRS
jgi:Ser/Thr protein kinase RdoA (MazF antagonist)